jgi:beta-lactamase class A
MTAAQMRSLDDLPDIDPAQREKFSYLLADILLPGDTDMNRSACRVLNRYLRLQVRDLASGIADVQKVTRVADIRDNIKHASAIAHQATLRYPLC